MNKDDNIVKLIIDESKKLQDVLNEKLLSKFIELHNIPKDRSEFYSKQEIVAKRGYFLDVKKKYALRVVNKEGVPVEKIEETGLVTRRSDYPSFTKEKLKTIFNYLLMEEKIPFGLISKYIKEIELEIKGLILSGQKCIARPASFSKELESYKKIPYQVEGMNVWNILEYKYFIPGTKGYLFRITGIDPYIAPKKVIDKMDKIKEFKWIAIPYEEESLPSYYKIDIDQMLSVAWTDRVKEFLKPVLPDINKKLKIEKQSLATF
jgi:hypothetical protein